MRQGSVSPGGLERCRSSRRRGCRALRSGGWPCRCDGFVVTPEHRGLDHVARFACRYGQLPHDVGNGRDDLLRGDVVRGDAARSDRAGRGVPPLATAPTIRAICRGRDEHEALADRARLTVSPDAPALQNRRRSFHCRIRHQSFGLHRAPVRPVQFAQPKGLHRRSEQGAQDRR